MKQKNEALLLPPNVITLPALHRLPFLLRAMTATLALLGCDGSQIVTCDELVMGEVTQAGNRETKLP